LRFYGNLEMLRSVLVLVGSTIRVLFRTGICLRGNSEGTAESSFHGLVENCSFSEDIFENKFTTTCSE